MKNKTLRYLIAIICILPLNNIAFSQTTVDGLRYSQTFNGGTARFVSMGGAFGALGADFSSLSINPAGLGVYKSSEFTITPSFKHQNISSTYNGTSASDSKNQLTFDNVGFVMSFNPYKSDESGIQNFNIGFGYTRTNDFYSNSIAIGDNVDNSIMDYFVTKANGYYYADLYSDENQNPFLNSSAPWDVIMAWNTYLIYDTVPGSNGTQYYAPLGMGEGVTQKNVVNTQGGSGEYNISFAMNVSNKFYIGATLGITDYNYTYNATYSEDAFSSNSAWPNGDRFYYSDYIQYYETKGTGYNLKIGGIYTPTHNIRIGLGIHTPTFYSFNDNYSYTMKSNFDIAGIEQNYTSKSPLGQYDYEFETPFKIIGSFAYIIKNFGLVSVDVEHLDYSSMKFRNGGDGDNFSDLNLSIENTYRNVTNVRVGGEYKIGDFALRAGYAFYPSPYKKDYLNEKANTSQISGGFGYKTGNFSVDMAYVQTMRTEKYQFYSGNGINSNPVTSNISDGKFLVTFGFRF